MGFLLLLLFDSPWIPARKIPLGAPRGIKGEGFIFVYSVV